MRVLFFKCRTCNGTKLRTEKHKSVIAHKKVYAYELKYFCANCGKEVTKMKFGDYTITTVKADDLPSRQRGTTEGMQKRMDFLSAYVNSVEFKNGEPIELHNLPVALLKEMEIEIPDLKKEKESIRLVSYAFGSPIRKLKLEKKVKRSLFAPQGKAYLRPVK